MSFTLKFLSKDTCINKYSFYLHLSVIDTLTEIFYVRVPLQAACELILLLFGISLLNALTVLKREESVKSHARIKG